MTMGDAFPANVMPSQTSRRRCLFTDTSCPVIFRLPAFPVPPTLTCSSNSPPIFLLHFTHTSVSGMTSSRSGGISAPQTTQHLAFRFIIFLFHDERFRYVRKKGLMAALGRASTSLLSSSMPPSGLPRLQDH